jgi:YegS/Rv2252/BmrU family lipid kinase
VRALIVVNPLSRHGRRLGGAVRAQLEQLGIELVEDPTHSERLDAIVVAGGDGTLARTIGMALALDVPIGIVPLGTFNDLARTLAIPLDLEGACAVIASGHTRTIDVARVNGAYYVTEASIGLSSRLTRLQKVRDKQRFGFFAIVASALAAVKYLRPFQAEVSYDDKRVRLKAVQLTVANSNHFGGFITVEDAAIDDGWLDLYSVEVDRFTRVASVVHAMISGERQAAEGVRTFRSRAFGVTTRRWHHITADGEPAGTTPARFEILPGALRVFVPGDDRAG